MVMQNTLIYFNHLFEHIESVSEIPFHEFGISIINS